MESSTVDISFNGELLEQLDQVAREESRSRSELIRDAAREAISRRGGVVGVLTGHWWQRSAKWAFGNGCSGWTTTKSSPIGPEEVREASDVTGFPQPLGAELRQSRRV